MSFALIFSLFTGCKSAPESVVPEEEVLPDILVLSEDEIKIINAVNDHIITLITRELKNSKDDMQVCINNEFYLHRVNTNETYETDLKNSENFLKGEMSVNNDIVLSFIKRNTRRINVDKDVQFKADFFWKGGKPKKNYFKILYSLIGFDSSNTKALMHVYVDLPNWVFTEYVYLEKKDENWFYVRSRLH